MSTPYATGAVAIYVTTPKTDGPKFLGFSEQGPSRTTERTYKQVMNDLMSQRAFDFVYAGGEEAILSFVLTDWNDDIAQQLEMAPISKGLGFSTIFDQGSLMGAEELAIEIWYAFTFRGPGSSGAPMSTVRTAYPFMEGGRHYLQALFWGPEQDETGTHERKKHMVFKCWKQTDKTVNPWRFDLFDFDMSGLPAPN